MAATVVGGQFPHSAAAVALAADRAVATGEDVGVLADKGGVEVGAGLAGVAAAGTVTYQIGQHGSTREQRNPRHWT